MPVDQPTNLTDGTISFNGGMDASRRPSEVGQDQYFKGINVLIPRANGGITQRGGLHHQNIDWSGSRKGKKIYETGHFQGSGSYWNGSRIVNLRVIDGYIIELIEVMSGEWKGRILNGADPNNPNRTKAWVTTIPFGAIVNDGQALPFIIGKNNIRRSNPDDGEITAGQMGAYVQNRFFYVNPEGNFIQASDFKGPTSIRNSIDTNIHGFLNPQDEYQITAIGRQKALLESAIASVLSWSDGQNIYSADVRGSRESWGDLGSNFGKIQQVVPSIGATSSYSFVNFNTNLYFRNAAFGLCDMRQSQSQFTRENDFESQSKEVDYWFGRDTSWMLDQCYTVKYHNRLYTTTAGEISDSGYVYWNGMIVSHPNPDGYNREENFPRRFEGLVTGVRPWCLTVTEPPNFDSQFLIDSYDIDGVNRLYKYVDDADYDLNHFGHRVEIESSIETRGYTFGYSNEPKKVIQRFYSLGSLKRDLLVKIDTRAEGYGKWMRQWNMIHRVSSCCNNGSPTDHDVCFKPKPIKPQERKRVIVGSEPENDKNNPDFTSNDNACSRQYRFTFKGSYRLYQFVVVANPAGWDKTIHTQAAEDTLKNPYMYIGSSDYTYNIATDNNNEFVSGMPTTLDTKSH